MMVYTLRITYSEHILLIMNYDVILVLGSRMVLSSPLCMVVLWWNLVWVLAGLSLIQTEDFIGFYSVFYADKDKGKVLCLVT
jgi:hypothetical protein